MTELFLLKNLKNFPWLDFSRARCEASGFGPASGNPRFNVQDLSDRKFGGTKHTGEIWSGEGWSHLFKPQLGWRVALCNSVTCYQVHVLCLRTYVITRSEQQPRLGLRSVCLCLFMSCSCFSSSVQLQPLFAPWLKEHEKTRSPDFVAFFLSFFLSFFRDLCSCAGITFFTSFHCLALLLSWIVDSWAIRCTCLATKMCLQCATRWFAAGMQGHGRALWWSASLVWDPGPKIQRYLLPTYLSATVPPTLALE